MSLANDTNACWPSCLCFSLIRKLIKDYTVLDNFYSNKNEKLIFFAIFLTISDREKTERDYKSERIDIFGQVLRCVYLYNLAKSNTT